MKSYLLLLKLNLTNLLGGMRLSSFRKADGKIDVARIVILLVAALGIAVLVGSVLFLEYMMYSVVAAIQKQQLLIGITVLLSMVMTLLFGVVHTLASLYFNRDSVNLAHLPVTSRTVLVAKWTEIYLPEVLLSAGFLMPLLVLYGIDLSAGVGYYLRAVLLVAGVPLYPLAVALLLSSLLGRTTALTKHKEAWVVLGTILLLVVVVGGEMLLLPTIPEDADAGFFLRLLMDNEAMLTTVLGAFPPILWATHSVAGNWGEWALFLILGVAVMAALLYLVGGSYLATCLRHTEQGVTHRKRGKAEKGSFRARSPLTAIFWREMNEVLKTPVYLLNGVLGVLMMPLFLCGGMIGAFSSGEMDNILAKKDELLGLLSPLDLTLIIAAMFSLICWITPVISTAVSREGKRLQVTRMIPVSARTILNAKLLVNFAINAVGAVIIAVVLTVLLGAAYLPHVAAALVMVLLLNYATGAVNLVIDVTRPLLNWKNETQVMKQNMNQMIGMLLSTLMIALLVAPPFFLLSQAAWVRMAVVCGVLLLQCGVAFLLMRKVAEPRYAAIEP